MLHELGQPLEPSRPFSELHYTYVNVPTNFKEDRWIIAAELRPGNRKIVHHAHVFVVEPSSTEAVNTKDTKAAADPAIEYAKWLRIRQGSLEWVRPEAPVIDNGRASP